MGGTPRILVIDSDVPCSNRLHKLLGTDCFVTQYPTLEAGLEHVKSHMPDVVVLSIDLGPETVEMIGMIAEIDPASRLVLLTRGAYTDKVMLAAMKAASACHYFEVARKQDPEEVDRRVRLALTQ